MEGKFADAIVCFNEVIKIEPHYIRAWQQDILPKESRGRFFGLMGITGALGTGVGGYISSVIADELGIFWIFVALSLFLWASLPILNRVPVKLIKKKKKTYSKSK